MLKCACSLLLAVVLITPAAAQPPIHPGIAEAIRREGNTGSEIMRTLHTLTDVYGPRLTGSPAARAAAEWAVQRMTSWGFTNGHLEPWNFGHPGWANERVSAHIISPVKDQLTCEV